MQEVAYFFDTYALVEIVKANVKYEVYSGEKVTITLFNLVELYWSVLSDFGESKADDVFTQFRTSVVEIEDAVLKEAVKFRKEQKKRDLSYTDCIGYIYAKHHGMKFLTGDKEFENMENVEFVRK